MPKQTFYNLSNKKKEKIIDAAIKEFEKYSFDASSVNRIVANSNIAKGSFYQYFDGKKDLYEYIIELIINKKLEFLKPLIENEYNNLDFFETLFQLYVGGLKFAKEYPEFMKIGNKLIFEDSTRLYKEIMGKNLEKSLTFFKNLIANSINKNEIRKDIDIEFISYIITVINSAVAEYYLMKGAKKFDEDLLHIADKSIEFIKKGIKEES